MKALRVGAGGSSANRLALMGAGIVVVAGGLSGCSSSQLDNAKLAETIQADVQEGLGEGTTVTVDCPGDTALAKDTKSTCTATIGTQSLTYEVVQTDDEGNVTYTRTKAVLDLDKAETLLASQLADQLGGQWQVECVPVGEERFYVVDVKGTFACAASGTNGDGEEQSGELTVTVDDLEGNVSWEAK